MKTTTWIIGAFAWLLAGAGFLRGAPKTENVFLIMSDGLRWQEVFRGAEERLLTKSNGVRHLEPTRNKFWRETPDARRAALLPFLWETIAANGQLFGNQDKGSIARVLNTQRFSYPGYNETITGFADPQIDSNDKKPNWNTNVFEWLAARPRYRKSVALLATWDVFPYIFSCERNQLPIWPQWENRFSAGAIKPPPGVENLMKSTTPLWQELVFDSYLFETALAYIPKHTPRVVFLGLGETDEWAHEQRYEYYLQAAHHVDRFVRTLWDTVQTIPQYRGKTTFIVTADHGRGQGRAWTDHGKTVAGAEAIWMAVIGPDTPALGERRNVAEVTQSQIAATIARLLGEDFASSFPRAGKAIESVIAPAEAKGIR